ncbi:MAG: N-6 DNA methylase, partial [Candidatus Lokiarchaeota archaeon]|nr:N-6 DNA methylase [Candidatus Lokiarchaeota archaeon]MBD3339137.1 N-6 DNA methylase [Candidatus Lokiarchaeota archaeon]
MTFTDKSLENNTLRKSDLVKVSNLKLIFSKINQHLYGKLKYTHTDTRSRSKVIINLLLCKLVDELNKNPDQILDFQIKETESKENVLNRIQTFFIKNVKQKYPYFFEENENISLDKHLVVYIVKELQPISLTKSSKDILSDAFEIFVSKILKDEGGQFFTPPNVIKFMVNYLDPEVNSKILDPACGHGGFLLEVKDYLLAKIHSKFQKDNTVKKMRQKAIFQNLFGIDKDLFLAKLCKLYLEILAGGNSHIYCEDSLDVNNYHFQANNNIKDNYFDYIFTNPPFGAKIPINNKDTLQNYELGRIWKIDRNNVWKMKKKLVNKQPPQI